jgi:glutamyl/glutaminyl-tRNA synthetase
LRELMEQILPYFQDGVAYDAGAAAKFLKDPALPELLETLRDRYAQLPDFNKDTLEAALRTLSEERGVKAGVLIHPTRMALSGATGGPPLFDLIELMGRDRTLGGLSRFIAFLRQGASPQG